MRTSTQTPTPSTGAIQRWVSLPCNDCIDDLSLPTAQTRKHAVHSGISESVDAEVATIMKDPSRWLSLTYKDRPLEHKGHCFKCGKHGHCGTHCPQADEPDRICWNCHVVYRGDGDGHLTVDCPKHLKPHLSARLGRSHAKKRKAAQQASKPPAPADTPATSVTTPPPTTGSDKVAVDKHRKKKQKYKTKLQNLQRELEQQARSVPPAPPPNHYAYRASPYHPRYDAPPPYNNRHDPYGRDAPHPQQHHRQHRHDEWNDRPHPSHDNTNRFDQCIEHPSPGDSGPTPPPDSPDPPTTPSSPNASATQQQGTSLATELTPMTPSEYDNLRNALPDNGKGADTIVATDGSAKSKRAGSGVYYGDRSYPDVAEPCGGIKPTNNRAELSALVLAVYQQDKNTHVHALSDSDYSRNEWDNFRTTTAKIRGGAHVRDNYDILLTLHLLCTRKRVRLTISWVKAHVGIHPNEMADRLADIGRKKSGGVGTPLFGCNAQLNDLHDEALKLISSGMRCQTTGVDPIPFTVDPNKSPKTHRLRTEALDGDAYARIRYTSLPTMTSVKNAIDTTSRNKANGNATKEEIELAIDDSADKLSAALFHSVVDAVGTVKRHKRGTDTAAAPHPDVGLAKCKARKLSRKLSRLKKACRYIDTANTTALKKEISVMYEANAAAGDMPKDTDMLPHTAWCARVYEAAVTTEELLARAQLAVHIAHKSVAIRTRIGNYHNGRRRKMTRDILNATPREFPRNEEDTSAHYTAQSTGTHQHADHFEDGFDLDPPPTDESKLDDAVSRATAAIRTDELRAATKRKGKATTPGCDGISYAVYKNMSDEGWEAHTALFNLMFDVAYMPECYRHGSTILLDKSKPDPRDFGSWRPITIQCAARNIYSAVLAHRGIDFTMSTDQWSAAQKGYIPGQSVGYQALRFVLSIEDTIIEEKDTVFCLLDLSNAFPTAQHGLLEFGLKFKRVPEKLRAALMAGIRDNDYTISAGNLILRPIKQQCGIPQGASESSFLFVVGYDPIHHKIQATCSNYAFQFSGIKPTELAATLASLGWCDDTALAGKNMPAIAFIVGTTSGLLRIARIYVNSSKSLLWPYEAGAPKYNDNVELTLPTSPTDNGIIPVINEMSAYRYIGNIITPTLSWIPAAEDLIACVKGELEKFIDAKLGPAATLDIIRTRYANGKIRWKLQIPFLRKGDRKRIDVILLGAVKKCLNLGSSCQTNFLHADVECGGLGFPSCEEIELKAKVSLALDVLNHEDDATRVPMIASIQRAATVHNLATSATSGDMYTWILPGGRLPRSPPTKTQSAVRKTFVWRLAIMLHERKLRITHTGKKWILEKHDKKGPRSSKSHAVIIHNAITAGYNHRLTHPLKQTTPTASFSGNKHLDKPASFGWIRKGLSEKGCWAWSLRAINDALPTPRHLWRWYGLSSACPSCKELNAGLLHVLNGCTHWSGAYVNRHNSVATPFREAINATGQLQHTHQDRPVTRINDNPIRHTKHNKPDDVFVDAVNKKIFIVEYTVPFESRFGNAFKEKKEKYKALVANIRTSGFDDGWMIKIVVIIIGSRGGVHKQARTGLRIVGIKPGLISTCLAKAQLNAIVSSMKIYWAHKFQRL